MQKENDAVNDPIWCEDCELYHHFGTGTEGKCKIDGHYTCYCDPICEHYERRVSPLFKADK